MRLASQRHNDGRARRIEVVGEAPLRARTEAPCKRVKAGLGVLRAQIRQSPRRRLDRDSAVEEIGSSGESLMSRAILARGP